MAAVREGHHALLSDTLGALLFLLTYEAFSHAEAQSLTTRLRGPQCLTALAGQAHPPLQLSVGGPKAKPVLDPASLPASHLPSTWGHLVLPQGLFQYSRAQSGCSSRPCADSVLLEDPTLQAVPLAGRRHTHSFLLEGPTPLSSTIF